MYKTVQNYRDFSVEQRHLTDVVSEHISCVSRRKEWIVQGFKAVLRREHSMEHTAVTFRAKHHCLLMYAK